MASGSVLAVKATAVQLRESQLNALIGLYQVLGGGWRVAAER